MNNEAYLYLGSDNHLYIPDEEIYSVDLSVLTIDRDGAKEASGCNEVDNCKSKFLSDFICPDKLLPSVKDMTIQRLGLLKQVKEDSNPDSKEGN